MGIIGNLELYCHEPYTKGGRDSIKKIQCGEEKNLKIKFLHFPMYFSLFSKKKCLEVCATCERKNVVEC
jgi:hypothetical protein